MTDLPGVRLAEIVGALALAQDGAFGQPADAQLRAAMIATALAERLRLDPMQREAVHWAAPLRYLGCTSHAHDVAVLFGDEIDFRAHSLLADPSNPLEMLRDIVTRGGGGRSPVDRVRTVLATLAGGRGPVALSFRTACEVGDKLAARLGIPEGPREALRFGFERWNGRGFPGGAKVRRFRCRCASSTLPATPRCSTGSEGETTRLKPFAAARAGLTTPRSSRAFFNSADVLLTAAESTDPWDAWLPSERFACG